VTISKGNLPEQDHIFSRDELKKAGIKEDKINSIYNIRYITQADNRGKKNTLYSVWFDDEKERIDEFKKHLIPEGKWCVENFDKFREERKKLMAQKFMY